MLHTKQSKIQQLLLFDQFDNVRLVYDLVMVLGSGITIRYVRRTQRVLDVHVTVFLSVCHNDDVIISWQKIYSHR